MAEMRKLIATLIEVARNGFVWSLYFRDESGFKWGKQISQDFAGDHVLAHFGVSEWDRAADGIGKRCQLVIDDGKVRYINAVDQTTGEVLFRKPPPSPAIVRIRAEQEADDLFAKPVGEITKTIHYLMSLLPKREREKVVDFYSQEIETSGTNSERG